MVGLPYMLERAGLDVQQGIYLICKIIFRNDYAIHKHSSIGESSEYYYFFFVFKS